MEEYILIFRHEDGAKVASSDQLKEWMRQTQEWVDGIVAQDKFVSSCGILFDDAHVVWPNEIVTQGPFGKRKETLGGYIIVKANSVEEAIQFAKGSPVLQGEGNSVEVRKVRR